VSLTQQGHAVQIRWADIFCLGKNLKIIPWYAFTLLQPTVKYFIWEYDLYLYMNILLFLNLVSLCLNRHKIVNSLSMFLISYAYCTEFFKKIY